ncbi:Fc.00g061430.m01.CDS01 [Cosmosporella sp. VM-42]
MFLCTHTLLCLNIPAPTDTWLVLLRRRVMWMALTILGPEIVLTYAAGQWSRARHSVEAFRKSGYKQWTMRRAFFADMGGFVLHAVGCDPFPLNAKQLHWLIVNNHIDYPRVEDKEIGDKSKQDRLAKIITATQMTHLVVECIGRGAQNLAITALELNTLAIVVCSLMTAFAWLHKPADVRSPIVITTHKTMIAITNSRPWKTTPLDFVDENGPGWSLNVQPFMKMPVVPSHRPIQRIPDDSFPMNPYGAQEYCVCFATLLLTGLHITG